MFALLVLLDEEEVDVVNFVSGDGLTEMSTSHFVSSPHVAVYKY